MVKTFDELGIDVPGRAGNSNVACPFDGCQNRKKRGQPTLSLKMEQGEDGLEGPYLCHHCQESGYVVEKRRADKMKENEPEVGFMTPAPPPPKVEQTFTAPKTLGNALSEATYQYFEGRGLSRPTVDHFRVTERREWMPKVLDDKGNMVEAGERPAILFPFFRQGVLVNIKFRGKHKAFRLNTGSEQILFNIDAVAHSPVMVIVEGEPDCMALHEAGVPYAVSVPNGAPPEPKAGQPMRQANLNYIDRSWPQVHDKKKVIIAVDNDGPGQRLKAELIRRFGEHRCWTVSWPDGCKDANEVLLKMGADALRELIEKAKPMPISHVYEEDELDEEMIDLYDNGWPTHVDLAWPNFNEHCRFRPSQLVVITGHTNCFIGETPVRTKRGFVAIKDIRPGDMVLSLNHDTYKSEYRPVLRTIRYEVEQVKQRMITMTLTTGERITCTEEHEFYDGREYVQAGVLAGREVDGRFRNERALLCVHDGAATNDGLQGTKGEWQDSGDETCTRPLRIHENDDCSRSSSKNHQDAQASCAGISAEPGEQKYREPYKWGKGRQSSVQLGMGNGERESSSWLSPRSYIIKRREGTKSCSKKSPSVGDQEEVQSGNAFHTKPFGRVRGVPIGNKECNNVSYLEESSIVDYFFHEAAEPIYDLTVHANHNYTVGSSCYSVSNSGKSTWFDEVMRRTAKHGGWKWAVFSFEQQPSYVHASMMLEQIVGLPLMGGRRMNRYQHERARRFLHDHFVFVKLDQSDCSIKGILDKVVELVGKRGINGFLVDPWNEIEHKIPHGLSETLYVSEALSQVKQVLRSYNVLGAFVVHPVKAITDLKTGKLYPAKLKDCSGSGNFANKADIGLSLYRDVIMEPGVPDPISVSIEKIRYFFDGKRGMARLEYNLLNRRYREETQGEEVSMDIGPNQPAIPLHNAPVPPPMRHGIAVTSLSQYGSGFDLPMPDPSTYVIEDIENPDDAFNTYK